MADQLTSQQFAAKIRAKYPGAYDNVADDELTQRVVAKYPDYAPMVSMKPAAPIGTTPESLGVTPGLPGSKPKALQGKPTMADRIKSGDAEMPGSFEGKPENTGQYVPNGPGEMAAGVKDIVTGNFARGAHRVISGAGTTALPVAALTGLTPSALPTTASAVGGGMVGSKVVHAGAKALGATPDQADLAGDVGGIVAGGLAAGTTKAAVNVAGEMLAKPNRLSEITGTTPERIAELKTLPDRVEAVRQTVVNAEKAAHQAAKDSFPKFEKPIETGKMIEQDAAGPVMVDEWGEIKPRALVPETTTFDALQEQRSNLLKQITDEKRAVDRGAAPRYDLADMYEQLHKLDDTMSKAALDEGGPEGLAKLQAARQKFSEYMQDFHNTGSPVRKLLETKPGETAKVISHLTSPDSGARTLETLRKYGVDTKNIGQLLQGGERPVKVAVNEAAKLRKAGSDAEYTKQRYRESISQLETQDMPTRAEARLPKNAQASQYPSVVGKLAKQAGITPKSVTKFRIKHALKKLDGKP